MTFQRYERFNALHMSAAYVRLAKKEEALSPVILKDPMWAWLKKQVLRLDPTCPMLNEQTTGNLLWSVGHVYERDFKLLGLFPVLASRIEQLLPRKEFTAQEVSYIMWATNKMKECHPAHVNPLLKRLPLICDAVQQLSGKLDPQGVGNVLYAVGGLINITKAVNATVPAVAKRAVQVAAMMKPQELANSCWGLACCKYRDGAVLQTLATAAVEAAPTWPPDQRLLALSMMAGAFAKLNAPSKTLMMTVVKFTEPRLSSLSDWDVCVLAWSFRKLDSKSSFLAYRTKVAAEVQRRGLEPFVDQSELGRLYWQRGSSPLP